MKRLAVVLPLLLVALPVWGQTPAPIQVHIERVQNEPALLLDLASMNPVMAQGMGFIQLSGEAGKFSAPFSIDDFKPIKANTTSRRQFDRAGWKQQIEFRSLLWGRMIDALWPFRPFSTVPSGRYDLSVVVEQKNGQRIESNKLPITLPLAGPTSCKCQWAEVKTGEEKMKSPRCYEGPEPLAAGLVSRKRPSTGGIEIPLASLKTKTPFFKLCLDEKGKVENVFVLRSSGIQDLDRRICKGFKAFRFRAPKVNGKPVRSSTYVSHHFDF